MRPRRGFTLVEVMIALGILGVALVVLVKSIAGNVTTASDSFYMGLATDLARGKMYDLEEQLLQEGFQEGEQELDGDFSEEGWERIKWKAKITPTELPSLETLMGMGQEGGAGAGSGAGTGAEGEDGALGGLQDTFIGQMASQFGGDVSGPGAASQVQQFYPMLQQTLKAAVRKIVLTIEYDTGIHKEHFDVVLYVTDPAGMAKTLGPLWRN